MLTSNKVFAGLIIVLILSIHVITLMRFPAPFGDEAWMASRGWAFIQTGNSFGSLDRGVLDRYEGCENFFPWLSTAIYSLGVRLIGAPNLLSVRFVSITMGFTLLFAEYWLGVALDSKQLGILGVAFTAFCWPFFLSAHLGRPDIIAVAFGFADCDLF